MPLFVLIFEIVMFALFRPPILDLPMVCTGFCYSWWYLRFVRRNQDGTVGDYNDEFSFVSMFPSPLKRFISPMSNFVFAVCKLLGFFKDRVSRELQAVSMSTEADDVSDSLQNDITQLLTFEEGKPAAVDPVAERRRARARKTLDERMAALNSAPGRLLLRPTPRPPSAWLVRYYMQIN
jgi:hypothetical protein